ncbi:hypothetical protein AWZ03_013801 [Drosophila navojoa]|uniref:Uncharacterized protein n=1 Tax=Drosophila navojoa TaxID=7232 RepID=A0A484AVA0_DRONA|nr:hypothetical protein AWZ03_013801 [Drosophila navojoa]
MFNKCMYLLFVCSLLTACSMAQTLEDTSTLAPAAGGNSTRRDLVRNFMNNVQRLIADLMKSLQQLTAAQDGRISIS